MLFAPMLQQKRLFPNLAPYRAGIGHSATKRSAPLFRSSVFNWKPWRYFILAASPIISSSATPITAFSSTQKSQNSEPRITSERVLHKGAHLRLSEQTFQIGTKSFKWERVQRNMSREGQPSCVIMIPILQKQGKEHLIVLKQFRPAVKNFCIEAPAGLIDPGESAETAAARELEEETGYITRDVQVLGGSPLGMNPGFAGELGRFALLKVNGDAPENQNPVQKLEPMEHIEVLEVPLEHLEKDLDRFREEGMVVDAKLQALTLGFILRNNL